MPPTGGPRIGPTSAGISSQDMALTMSLRATLRISTRRPTGSIMAPPRPCSNRAITRKNRFGACAQRSEPTTKTAMAERKTVRDPKRSAMAPLAGMKIARLRR